MRRLAAILLVLGLASPGAEAGFTETLGEGTFLLDEAFTMAWIDSIWDNAGRSAPIIEPMERYEPGGGKQGVLHANPAAQYLILVNQLQYGLLDDLAIAVGIPVVLRTRVDPNLSWEPGDYQRQLGRPYSEQDFWEWAASMGQEKPTTWIGNQGVLSDMIVGARFRFSDRIAGMRALGLAGALTVSGVIPTGRFADPEEIVAVGTTMWELHFQGDLAFHLGLEKRFEELEDRLKIGLDAYYEVFFTRTLTAADGDEHPLLLTQSPYVGQTYDVKPGDFSGFAVEIEGVPYIGPAWGTWLTDGSAARAEAFPPVLSLGVRYTFQHLQQSDWRSDFPRWDWEREKYWRPGYKNILDFRVSVSLLRFGAPLLLYANYRTLALIPGKNCRAAQVLSLGLRVPLKFW